ncbi:asparagine synthase (glutamine-hydrolysing) [Paenibacillus sp. UNC496MF]|uniref:asparagine synthase-related protein n=1 Tax=Paenibacillus sp. UNC496MF TaxID=1502753 RepID=UPI0008E1FBD5|nr:asparagine synthase-related protein [Paenibacillus sp. UNC496MF]SFI28385.1 asparagine synthase (glutamine-hydrolysing) [Paenibacillus sp. UNC496MF]
MSAIAGLLRLDGGTAGREEGAAMMAAMERYDADDVGTWTDGPVFLGCRAKWITPESVHERLPFHDPANGLAIVSDAMLDNRRELFGLLDVPQGLRAGMPDGELILLAYRKWGRSAPEYLIGDFAFVLWDETNRLLFGARDLLGHRCLYYSQSGGRFAFATAMAPLLALPGAAKALNEAWLAEFMAIPEMYESTDVGATPYRNVHQVPPAHAVVVADGRVSLFGYGSLEPKEMLRLKSDGEYEEAFRDVFREAVKSRLRTHRQVAATLSGGLDSGAVASFAARALRDEGKRLHTYSYVPAGDFEDWTPASATADESRYMKATARHVGNISDRYLDFDGISPMAQVDEWLDILETPYKFFENSFWLKGVHEQAAGQGAGVLLTGARGNFTVSWGPAVYVYARLLREMKWLRLMREFQLYRANKGIGGSRLLSFICREAFPALGRRGGGEAGPGIPELLIHPDFARRTGVFGKLRDNRIGPNGTLIDDPVEVRKEKLKSLPVGNKNGASATKLSLRYGVWERDPTSDPRVVRFCFSVPVEQYAKGGFDRALIRRATKHYLPDEVRLNQRVRGIQGADWVHRILPAWAPLERELRQLCADPAAEAYLHTGRIREALDALGGAPRPEHAFRPELRMLMRSLIIYRFLKRFA